MTKEEMSVAAHEITLRQIDTRNKLLEQARKQTDRDFSILQVILIVSIVVFMVGAVLIVKL